MANHFRHGGLHRASLAGTLVDHHPETTPRKRGWNGGGRPPGFLASIRCAGDQPESIGHLPRVFLLRLLLVFSCELAPRLPRDLARFDDVKGRDLCSASV